MNPKYLQIKSSFEVAGRLAIWAICSLYIVNLPISFPIEILLKIVVLIFSCIWVLLPLIELVAQYFVMRKLNKIAEGYNK